MFTVLLLIAGCTSTDAPDNAGDGLNNNNKAVKRSRSKEEAAQFIRRYPALQTGLINYFDPADIELLERHFNGETVIFRLDNTGDGDALYNVAIDRAAEFAEKYHWPAEDMDYESPGATEFHVALIGFESMSIPAGAKAGDTIPVRIYLRGNASDIRGGFVYPTPMCNKAGKTVAFIKKGYLPFNIEKFKKGELTAEQIADANNLTVEYKNGDTVIILRNTVTLASDVTIDDLSSDQIILPLIRNVDVWENSKYVRLSIRTLAADLVPDVMRGIKKGMAEKGFEVEGIEVHQKIVITPVGIYEETLRQIKEHVESLRITVAPKNNVVIVFDEEKGQISVFGPARHRFLYGDVFLTTDPFTRERADRKPHPLRFRLSCRIIERAVAGKSRRYGFDNGKGGLVDGHPGKTKLSWTRYNSKNEMIEDGVDILETTDVSDILRHLWTKGISPYGALAFVYEAKTNMALTAEMGINYRKLNLDDLRRRLAE
ncbi:MAG: hypothetical protein L3J82_00135 [Planctomycetes bacterium]|nr:hypothetical protein [Planctomycetota bacterium]